MSILQRKIMNLKPKGIKSTIHSLRDISKFIKKFIIADYMRLIFNQ